MKIDDLLLNVEGTEKKELTLFHDFWFSFLFLCSRTFFFFFEVQSMFVYSSRSWKFDEKHKTINILSLLLDYKLTKCSISSGYFWFLLSPRRQNVLFEKQNVFLDWKTPNIYQLLPNTKQL